jgi:hypothetical protein
MAFNDKVNPKAETKLFKIYADVSESGISEEWELQGRGVTSWTVEQNQDINKESDVLGFVDMERGTAQPTQSGVSVNIRKGSKFAEMLFDALFSGDMSKLNAVKILQKFEFVDGATEGNCKARIDEECMIAINNFAGESGGYLGFEIDIHYSNNFKTGEMAKVDGETIEFTPDAE